MTAIAKSSNQMRTSLKDSDADKVRQLAKKEGRTYSAMCARLIEKALSMVEEEERVQARNQAILAKVLSEQGDQYLVQ